MFAQGRARLDHIISYIHIPRFPVIVAGGIGAFYYIYIYFFPILFFRTEKRMPSPPPYTVRRDDHRGRGRRPRTRSPATAAAMVPRSRSVRFVGRRSSSTAATGGRTGRDPIAIVFPPPSGTLTWS